VSVAARGRIPAAGRLHPDAETKRSHAMAGRHAAGWLALALGAAGVGAGCNPSAPAFSGSREEATVTGIVRVRGKPVTGGEITFRASNVNRPDAPTKNARIGKDGRYTIRTLVGENFVMVVCKELFLR
jgi:hypothetical protein